MQGSTKERSRRLQMFARLAAENQSNSMTSAQKNEEPEKRPAGTQHAISSSERQEMADMARIPLTRPILGHQRGSSQPPPMEPLPRVNSASPVQQQRGRSSVAGNRADMFSGSHLGEDFMVSETATSKSESDETTRESTPEPEELRYLPGRFSRFEVTNAGLLKFIPGTGIDPAVQNNDGLPNGTAIDGHRHDGREHTNKYFGQGRSSTPPVDRNPKRPAPARQVRIRTVDPSRHNVRLMEEKRIPSPAPKVTDWRNWRNDRTIQLAQKTIEEDYGRPSSSIGEDDGRTSPRMTTSPSSPLKPGFNTSSPVGAVPSYAPRNKKRRTASPDYDDMALSTMAYKELQKEPFDFDPAKNMAHITHGAAGGNLSARLEQYRHQTGKEQEYLFRNMSLDDWETAGDWFADQFAGIMHKLRDARRGKRQMIQEFEKEAAAREQAVRSCIDGLDRKLARMREDGQRVINPRGR